jgi:hypothetical protein
MADPAAFLFAQESEPSTSAATEASLTGTRRIYYLSRFFEYAARLVIHAPVTP